MTIPAQTTVYAGALTDSLPSQLTFEAATAAFSATGQSPATELLPAGFVLDVDSGDLAFPATYTNDTDVDQLVEVEIRARVTPRAGGNNSARQNTAFFDSQSAAVDGSPLPQLSDPADVVIVFGNPDLLKSNNAPPSIGPGTRSPSPSRSATAATAGPRCTTPWSPTACLTGSSTATW